MFTNGTGLDNIQAQCSNFAHGKTLLLQKNKVEIGRKSTACFVSKVGS